jgi:hypothetical protein
VYDEEWERVAQVNSSFDDAERHVAGDEHDKGNRNKIGILFLEEDEHSIQEDAFVSFFLRKDKFCEETK